MTTRDSEELTVNYNSAAEPKLSPKSVMYTHSYETKDQNTEFPRDFEE